MSAPELFDPGRLQLAREAAGLRKVDLAMLVNVSAPAISQFEHGAARPSPATLKRLALALEVPPGFFAHQPTAGGRQVSPAFFRSVRSTPQLQRTKAHARARLVGDVIAALEREVRLPDVGIPRDLLAGDQPGGEELEQLADQARGQLGVAAGAVANVVRLLEAHGVVVSRLLIDDDRVSAFSLWIDGRPVVMLTADKDDKARSRFDAAHELAHLILHPEPEAGNALFERQADAFAAALLMPASEITSQLPRRFDLGAYLELKRVWGVSVAALLYRARALRVMTDTAYRRAVIAMSGQYGRRREPGDLGSAERAVMLRRAAELAAPQDPIDALAAATHLHPTTIAEILDDPATTPRVEITREALLRDPR